MGILGHKRQALVFHATDNILENILSKVVVDFADKSGS